jgi:hypothetical protein
MLVDLECLTPKQLKDEFTRITRLPAKQNFVWLACPSLANCKIRSKSDWVLAIESIELTLTPLFCDIPVQAGVEDIGETVEPKTESAPEPVSELTQLIDAEISVVLNALNDENRDVTTVFQCGFLLASDHKQLYRKLAQRFHPDVNGDDDAELFVLMNEVYKQLTEEPETYGSEQESSQSQQQWGEETLEQSLSRQLGEDFEW